MRAKKYLTVCKRIYPNLGILNVSDGTDLSFLSTFYFSIIAMKTKDFNGGARGSFTV